MSILMTVAKNEKGLSKKKRYLTLTVDNIQMCYRVVMENGAKNAVKSIDLGGKQGFLRKRSQVNTTQFLKDFEEIVRMEIEKSIDHISRIRQDIAGHEKVRQSQLRTLKELWRLMPPLKYRENHAVRLMNEISARRDKITAGMENICLIKQRVLILQKELRPLFLPLREDFVKK